MWPLKSAIFRSVVVGAALVLVVLAAPWYPVATIQVVPQTMSYTTQLELTTGSVEVKETLTTYNISDVTHYSLTTIPFHKILGVVASAAILVLLALVLTLSTLLDQGIIRVHKPSQGSQVISSKGYSQ